MAKVVSKETVSLSEDQLRNWKLLEAFQRLLGLRLAHCGAGFDRPPSLGRDLAQIFFELITPALKAGGPVGEWQRLGPPFYCSQTGMNWPPRGSP